MITLITGTPGSGKTLYTVWFAAKMVKDGRRLMVDGIRDLAVEHEEVDEPWVRKWFDHVQQNDLVIVDEVQRYWGQRSVSVKTPEEIEKLHVHRHLGVDFILITQHPQRLDKTIRDLVGRHVHVRRLFGMKRAMLYEWDHCHNPNAGFRDAVKTQWSYPRDVFSLYHSAEMHTKQKAVIPKALFVLPVAAVAAVVLAWKGFYGVKGMTAANAKPSSAVVAKGASDASGVLQDPVAKSWRVAGRYSVGGEGYVLLVDAQGKFRSEPSDGFRGERMRLEGVVDGERVAVWSGAEAGVGGGSGNAIGGHK